MRNYIIPPQVLVSMVILLLAIGPATALNLHDMDTSVNPGKDLFSYANGKWIEQNPIPADRPWYTSVSEVQNSVNDRIKDIIEDAAAHPNTSDGYERGLIGTFYSTALDQNLANQVGIEPIRPLLDQIASADSREEIVNVTVNLMTFGITPFLYVLF